MGGSPTVTMAGTDMAADLRLSTSAPRHEITDDQLATWVAGIIGPGCKESAWRLHADGFKHTNALKAVQFADLQRAGFTCGDARALVLAVDEAKIGRELNQIIDQQGEHERRFEELSSLVNQEADRLDSVQHQYSRDNQEKMNELNARFASLEAETAQMLGVNADQLKQISDRYQNLEKDVLHFLREAEAQLDVVKARDCELKVARLRGHGEEWRYCEAQVQQWTDASHARIRSIRENFHTKANCLLQNFGAHTAQCSQPAILG